jgi:glucokinase
LTTPPFFTPPALPKGAAPLACVDVGGTKVAVSIADERGVRGRVAEPTVKHGDRGALGRQLLALIEQSCDKAGVPVSDIVAVGVASCGPFVLEGGLIELAAPNICGGMAGQARGLPNDWTSVPLEAPLGRAFRNVQIENDCIAALQAELRWGALQGLDHCAYITWSTGIGVGLCVDGRPLRGKHGNAGHAGHMFVSDNHDALCGCGNIGDLESLVAGNAMARRFGNMGYADAAMLLAAAQAGDAVAVTIVDELCRIMGRALYNLVVTLDLQAISMGGSVFWHHKDYLLPRLRTQLDGKLPALTAGVKLLPAGLQDKVGDYAALALLG